MFTHHARTQGFSLVELSIVLVILGLLTGGILAGQSLIRAAELRSITTSVDRFTTAHYTFRDKYFALPGDMGNATAFWGILAGTGSDEACQNVEAAGLPTCNGTGDGRVDSVGVTEGAERFRYWQHLANAGLIEGRYTGRTDSADPTAYVLATGKNTPSINSGNVRVDPYTQRDSATYYTATGFPFPGAFSGNEFTLSYRSTTTQGGGQMLLPEEAWNMDTKMDDGMPGRGRFTSSQMSWSGSPNCTTSDNATTALYNLTLKSKICRFVMVLR